MEDLNSKTKAQLIEEIERLQSELAGGPANGQARNDTAVFFEDAQFAEKVIDCSALSMWISDAEGTAIRTNRACLDFFGATEEEVIGKYNLLKDSVLEAQGFIPQLQRMFETGEVVSIIVDYDFAAVDHVDVENATHKIVKSTFTPVVDDNGVVTNVISQAVDLTERVTAEKKLVESEEKFRKLFSSSKVGIGITTLDGKFLDVNQAFHDMTGYTFAELERITYPEMTPEKWHKIEMDFVTKAIQTRSVAHYQKEYICKDGSVIPISISAWAIEDSEGKPDKLGAIVTDISERLKAEEAVRSSLASLKESDHFLNKAQQLAHVGHFKFDPMSNTVEGSNELCEIFGIPAGGLKFDDIVGVVHPDDLDHNTQTIYGAIENGTNYEIEHRLLLHDGTLKYVRITGETIFDDEGNTSLLVGAVQDISELKFAELKLQNSESLHRRMTANISDVIGIIDEQGKITYKSPNVEKWFGWKPEELVGTDGKKTVHPDDLTRIQRAFGGLLKSGPNHTISVQYRYLCKEGSYRHIELDATNMVDDEAVSGILVNYKDITDKRHMETQLRQKEKMQAIGQLAGGVAHDFNNQLGGIVGYADLIRDRVSNDPMLSEFADNILLGAKRSADLSAQLLAFSRQGKYQEVALDIHKVINETVSILNRSIDKRIVIKQHLDAESSSTKGDVTQVQSAILNLALNARDAMPQGGELVFSTKNVKIDADNVESGSRSSTRVACGSYIRICISDTGCGIDEETQKRIFEPFFTTKEKGKGTGMGLAAVYGTVKNHQGFVNVSSTPNQGSSFEVYLPLVAETSSIVDVPNDGLRVETGSGRVLLVEDDDLSSQVATALLDSLGYSVVSRSNGKEAIEFYINAWQEIDLVLLDMVMPVMDGNDAFRELKKINPEITALLVSGYSIDGDASELLNEGVAGFIQKPYRRVELAEKIASLLK